MIEILLTGVATAGVTFIVTEFEGPYGVFDTLRDKLAGDKPEAPTPLTRGELQDKNRKVQYALEVQNYKQALENYDSGFNKTREGFLHGLLSCPYCLTPYVSFVFLLLMSLTYVIQFFAAFYQVNAEITAFGVSTVVIGGLINFLIYWFCSWAVSGAVLVWLKK